MACFKITALEPNSKLISWLPRVATYKNVQIAIFHGHLFSHNLDELSEAKLRELMGRAVSDIAYFRRQMRKFQISYKKRIINKKTKLSLFAQFEKHIEQDGQLIVEAKKRLKMPSSPNSLNTVDRMLVLLSLLKTPSQ